MNMKRIMLFIIGVVGTTSLMAQEEKPAREERKELAAEKLKSELNLSEEQAQQVQAIRLKYAEERKAAMEASKAERLAQRDEIKAINERQREELTAVLNEEQIARLDALQQERMKSRESRPHRPHHRRGRH